ncbi:omptin family outer membrane protease [Rhizobium sp. FKL33]|uniref:omptin family outer membrane protease n=1 Tax=Rhizobium sp. FKL33 TaxID=2562307 RepID=UPI0010C068EC|nr:omptin family outer membrane protease [Rhizobium sp. FKL33]
MKFEQFLYALTMSALTVCSAHATDVRMTSVDEALWLQGGVGVMNVQSREYVYLGKNKASELDWDAKGVPVYSLTTGADLGGGWRLKGSVDVSVDGDGHMVDYDWVPGYAVDQTKDGWSDRSIHPDTQLEYYVSGKVELGRTLFSDETGDLSAGGGFQYTRLRWNAYGGSYIYSDGGFRNDVGELPDGLKGITYEQRVPTFFAGLDGSKRFDRLTLSGGVKGGVTLGIDDIDDHWLTGTRTYGDVQAAPVLMLNAAADFRITGATSVYFAAKFENTFRERGDMREVDTATGAETIYRDAEGASLRTMSVQFGIRARF